DGEPLGAEEAVECQDLFDVGAEPRGVGIRDVGVHGEVDFVDDHGPGRRVGHRSLPEIRCCLIVFGRGMEPDQWPPSGVLRPAKALPVPHLQPEAAMHPLSRLLLLPLLALFTLAACDTNDPDDGDRLRARDDTAETAPGQPVTIDVLANDDGDDVRLVDFDATTPNGRTVTRTDSDTGPGDEQLRYTPSNDFIGTDTFTYTITDDSGDTDEATVTVTVSASGGNRAPEARDNAAQTVEGQPVTI